MALLVIGPDQKAQIAALIAVAEANPVSLETVKRLVAAMEAGEELPAGLNDGMTIVIPHGYEVTYTHEEQPGGMCRHMSVAVIRPDNPNAMPSQAAMAAIMVGFGFVNDLRGCKIWVEEHPEKRTSINVLEPVTGNWAPFIG